jgi:hypothetical protein
MKLISVAYVIAFLVALAPMQNAQAANGNKSAKSKPLRVTVHPGKRIGGYSYSKTDSISPERTRRFIDPPRQSLGGPFDNGFFFETPTSPHGGSTPYMH